MRKLYGSLAALALFLPVVLAAQQSRVLQDSAVAHRDGRPAWNPGDFFGEKFAAKK